MADHDRGDYLPLITDIVVACAIAERIAAEYGLFLLPPMTVSCSHEHAGFAGTVSISTRTLIAVVTDVADSLRASGVDRLAIVNGHGGNYVLANVVQEANAAGPRMTLFPNRQDWEAARAAAGLRSIASDDMNAGRPKCRCSCTLSQTGYGMAINMPTGRRTRGRVCS